MSNSNYRGPSRPSRSERTGPVTIFSETSVREEPAPEDPPPSPPPGEDPPPE